MTRVRRSNDPPSNRIGGEAVPCSPREREGEKGEGRRERGVIIKLIIK